MILPHITPKGFDELTSLHHMFLDAKQKRHARQPAHVLVVEDDSLTRHIVSHELKDSYAVLSACDAQEAMTNYLLYAPDIVFLDIGLPDIDGFDLLEQFLSFDSDGFIVMFSASQTPEHISRALDSGAKGFIAKPFRKKSLWHYIHLSMEHYDKLLSELYG